MRHSARSQFEVALELRPEAKGPPDADRLERDSAGRDDLRSTSPAFADDLADEAELQFQLGADRYKTGDFRGALEHFLASNRLVPNAHRYYTTALDQESSPAKKKLEEALQRISSQVAVIKIETNPPNATVYIDRKDLGPRGESPRALGLAAGNYRIVVSKEGYEDASAGPLKVRAGTTTPVFLSLRAIVSSVRIQGEPGAVAHVDREDAPLAWTLPFAA